MPTKQQVENCKTKVTELLDRSMSLAEHDKLTDGFLGDLGEAFKALRKALEANDFNSPRLVEILDLAKEGGQWEQKIDTAKDLYDQGKGAEEKAKAALESPAVEEKESAAAGEPAVNSQQKELNEAAELMSQYVQRSGSNNPYSKTFIQEFMYLVLSASEALDNGSLIMPQAAFDVTKGCKFHWADNHVVLGAEQMILGLNTLLLSDDEG